jgi:hypothetical protein
METQAQPQMQAPTRGQRAVAAIRRDAPIDAALKDLYDGVIKVIDQMIGSGHFQPLMLKALVPVVIKSVQTFSDAQPEPMSGPQKQALAISITQYVLTDLQKRGLIDDEVYNDVMVGVVTFGPVLVDFAVEAWKKVNQVAEDVAAHGCAGCAKRNGCCVQ